MRVETVEIANQLPGTEWIRDGKVRRVCRVTEVAVGNFSHVVGLVFWSRPGKPERKLPKWLPYFNDWLSKAEPANDAVRDLVAEAGGES